jgi:rare lipoprotein A
MVIRTKLRNTSIKTPLGICILAGAATGSLVATVLTFSTPAVHADVELSRPAAIVAPAAPVASAPAAFLAPKTAALESAMKRRKDILRGLASWYGGVFNGRKTASGELYNMHAMTACHPTLPFGSMVRVVNLRNKRSVVVRINDRGDLGNEGRVIDLSRAAAEELAMTKSGLAKVRLEVVSLGGRDRAQE